MYIYVLQNDKEEHLENLKVKFKERNYPSDLVDEQFKKASRKNRKELINQQTNQGGDDNRVRLIFTHTHANPPIHKWVRECKHLLKRMKKHKTQAGGYK